MRVYIGAIVYSYLACVCYAQLDLTDPCSRTAIQLHDGDIAYFPSHITLTSPEDGSTRRKKAATANTGRLWPSGRVPYTISPLYTAEERRTVKSAMHHWENNTCIRFIPRAPSDIHYINLFPGSGCCSYIGRIASGTQGVSIGRRCFNFANVVHEIGHVVGFWHEQSRPDRDEHVDVLVSHIRPGFEINFIKLYQQLVNSYGIGYDYNSIMHYNRNYFSIDSRIYDTLQARDPNIPIGQAVALSPLDIIQANLLYSCDVDNPPPLSVTVPQIPPEPAFPDVAYNCTEYHQNLTGTIQSPGYPEYSHNTQCAWLIKVPPGYELSIQFVVGMEYSAGCTKDYLRVWKNLDQSDNYRVFCGRNYPFRISLENTAYLYYQTDSYNRQNSGQVHGFRATYTSIDINECLQSPCSFGCLNLPGSYECYCRVGFYLSADGRTCFDVNECALDNGGCTHNCLNRAGYFYCTCEPGYILDEDRRTCRTLGTSCNYLNGGCQHVCIQETDSKTCACNLGYELHSNGLNCHDVFECYGPTDNCQHNCHNTVGSFYCSCRNDFTLHSNGHDCIPDYSCAIDNGGCNHICKETSNRGAVCSCFSNGYTLNGRTCEDINECLDRRTCQYSCNNTDGSYQCLCQEGYGLASNGYSCQNIDECALGTHDCDALAMCFDLTGTYHCICPYGYTQRAGGRFCDDVDECSRGSNVCQHECVNVPGSYYCTCPPGYILFDFTICIDTNECIDDNGGCDHFCTNSDGSFSCRCRQGYILASDGSSCVDPTSPTATSMPPTTSTTPPQFSSPSPTPTTPTSASSSTPPSPENVTSHPSSPPPETQSTSTSPTSQPNAFTSDYSSFTTSPPSSHSTDPPSTTVSSPTAPSTSQVPLSTTSYTQPPTRHTTGATTPTATSLPLSCGGNLSSESGFFHTPNWPKTYPINTTCEWIITLPDTSSVVLITFNSESYGIGCVSDSVKVFDGLTESAAIFGPFCSFIVPEPIRTTSNEARVVFTAGRKHTASKKGFYATFNSTTPSTTTANRCGGNLTASNGSLNSPNWPETYPVNIECEWSIVLPDRSKVIEITFDADIYSFPGTATKCKQDWVAIVDGLEDDGPRFGRFCYTIVPDPIVTSSHVARVHFHSGDRHNRKRKGFRITYQSIDDISIS